MDFSPGHIAMLLAQDSPESSGMKIVRDPTRINAGHCFLCDSIECLKHCELAGTRCASGLAMTYGGRMQANKGRLGSDSIDRSSGLGAWTGSKFCGPAATFWAMRIW